MAYQITKNLAQSSLAAGYTAGDTTITLQTGEGARFPTTGDFVLAVDSPPAFFLKCTARSTDTLTVSASGFDGSTPGNVASGTKITNVITFGVLQGLLDATGGKVLIEEHTASASAALNFTGAFTAAVDSGLFDHFEIELVDVAVSTSCKLGMQFSSNGGYTFDTSTSNHKVTGVYMDSGGIAGVYNTSDAALYFFFNAGATDSLMGYFGTLKLGNMGTASRQVALTYHIFFTDTGAGSHIRPLIGCAAYINGANAMNAFRFIPSAGNIASGTIRVYGNRK